MSLFGHDDVITHSGMMMSWLTLMSAAHVLIFTTQIFFYCFESHKKALPFQAHHLRIASLSYGF